jgi:predicted transcriptional regulator of viral defense system
MDRTENQKKSLSSRESQALSELASSEQLIVDIGDIAAVLEISRKAASDLAFSLKEKGWLERIVHGTYLILPLSAQGSGEYTEHEYVIASALVEPMYVGYWSALNHHGLTEQIPMTVYIATTERAQEREIHGVTYRPVTVTDEKFFGYEPNAIGSTRVDISTIEKTLADCADHPEHCGGIRELAKGMQRADGRCSWETVVDDVRRVGNGAAMKRIVYLADQLEVDLPERDDLVSEFTSGYPLLDPVGEETGTRDSRYKLRLNVEPDQLLPQQA